MARSRSVKARRSRASGRRRKGGGEWKWYLAIFACVAIAVGIGVVSTRLIAAAEVDQATLCHRGGALNASVILLDLTDPLNETQQARLRTMIENEIRSSSTDTMLALGVVSENPANWGVRFAKCKPATGENANALYENPTLIAAQYEREFLTPVRQTVASVIDGQTENSSPIMEALQALVTQTPDFTTTRGQRKLIIVSDMLQHSQTLSFYRGQGWDHFAATEADARLAGNLAGVDVDIHRIPRAGSNVPSNEAVEDFWSRYFDRQGTRPPVVHSLGDL